MRLVATVDIMNRDAQSVGFGTRSRIRPVCKGVVQIRNRAGGRRFLVISTRKDVTGDEYDVMNIQKLRTQFAHDGFATIEISRPPLNIMIRNCDPAELQLFITELKKCGKELAAGGGSIQPIAKDRLSAPLPEEKKSETTTTDDGSLRKNGGVFKRPRSPELSKSETAKLRKCLTTNMKIVSVKKRESYPKEFQSSLEQVKIMEVGLRKIDTRILKLKHLTLLDLSGNRLKSMEELAKFPSSSLQTLLLSNNEIDEISWNLFSGAAFQNLKRLDLSNNGLLGLPESIVDLENLKTADFSSNELLSLPYNLICMKNLQNLDVSYNSLAFLPATLVCLRLLKLDLSNNSELHMINNDFGTCFVGYSEIPTLFEKTCEAIMTLSRNRKFPVHILPKLTQEFMKGCKYCVGCNRMSWRYKISKFSVRASDLGNDVLHSPGIQTCVVKQVLCFDCDIKNVNPRVLVPV
ncbi:unnamed protein product [Orchesella dallaii]|uniref:PIF1/LRR1 pleckstrin homology domain-containing protein n=1 Tax=Orchesella dallaii TaxID=48710 RepID=A0ABP1RG03_9HEXA